MSKLKIFLKYWLPVLLWMTVIFTVSCDTESFEHSSRIIAPLLRWLFPQISDATVHTIVFIARECAHVTEYAVFALLLWRAFHKPTRNDSHPWNRREAALVLLIVFFYASSDEIHQIFVPTRTPRLHDVVIDTLGGAMALFAIWFVKFRGRVLGTAQK